jgi:hypothetical protein
VLASSPLQRSPAALLSAPGCGSPPLLGRMARRGQGFSFHVFLSARDAFTGSVCAKFGSAVTARVVRCRLFTFAECFLDFFMSWLPFYFETKIILLLWLVHSNFSGAKFVYENFVDEVFHKHESDIDHSLAVCKAQVSLSLCNKFIYKKLFFI